MKQQHWIYFCYKEELEPVDVPYRGQLQLSNEKVFQPSLYWFNTLLFISFLNHLYNVKNCTQKYYDLKNLINFN